MAQLPQTVKLMAIVALLASCNPRSEPASAAVCTTPYADPDGNGVGTENNKECKVQYKTSAQIMVDMGLGWNLGNTLDAHDGTNNLNADFLETGWGNPITTQAMIDKVHEAGFKTLRVPVSWDNRTDSANNHTIDPKWLDRVEEVVNYGLKRNMYVMLDIHHTGGWDAPTNDNKAAAKQRLVRLWEQISARFGKYGEKLIFEAMNEPRVPNDWSGTQENFAVVNELNAAAVKTIRDSGGNNAKRLIVVPTYAAAGNTEQIEAFVMPNDNKLAVSIHAYTPYNFTINLGAGSTNTFTTTDVDYTFNILNKYFVSKKIPVILGEWGTAYKNNSPERVRYAKYYAGQAKSLGIPTIVWDNNNPDDTKFDGMGLLNRNTLTWYHKDIIDAIIN